jgi:hypothetical protein
MARRRSRSRESISPPSLKPKTTRSNESQNRPMTDDQPPDPDYIRMHEIARHIIHSSETLSIAQETLNSMSQTYDTIISTSSPAAPLSSNVKAELELQASLLKCVHLRSEAVEARLRNEINLVCYYPQLICQQWWERLLRKRG